MKKHLFLMAGLLLAFLFSSCSMLDDAGENQSADVALELSSELLQAVTSRTASARDVAEGEQINCLVEVNLKGAYSSKKSISIPAANPSSKEITFERIPVGKKLSAEVIIYKVRNFTDGQSSKTKVFKGKSDEITVKRGSNRITIKTINYYKDYPVSITLGFKNAEALPAQNVSIEVFAFKKGSAEIEDFYKRFIAGSCDFADYSVFLAKANADNEGYAAWATSTSTAQTSGISFDTNANQISLSGNMKLSQNENLVLIAFAKFTPANPALAPDGMIYAAYADVSSLSALNETAFVPGITPQTISLKMNKVKQELYALYNYNPQNQNGNYEFYITASIDNFNKANVTPVTTNKNSFTFDSKGNLYLLKRSDDSKNQIISNSIYTESSGTEELTTITIDQKNDILYGYSYRDSTGTINKLSLSGNTLSIGETYRLSNYSERINPRFAVYDGVAYIPYIVDNNNSYSLSLKHGALGESGGNITLTDSTLNITGLTCSSLTKVSDIIYFDGYLYILLSELYSDTNKYYSRGALIRVNLSDYSCTVIGYAPDTDLTTLKAACTIGGPKAYNSEDLTDYYTFTFVSSDSNPKYSVRAPYNDSASYFAGPEKFIAIKPKKLVVSDTGYIFYTLADGVFRCHKVDRVVEIELENLSMTNTVKKDVSLEFKTITNKPTFSSVQGFTTSGVYTYYTYSAGSFNPNTGDGVLTVKACMIED